MEGFLTVSQAAKRAKVSNGSVYRWLYDENVPLDRHKTGNGRVLVNEEQLDAWLKARNTPVIVTVPSESLAPTGT